MEHLTRIKKFVKATEEHFPLEEEIEKRGIEMSLFVYLKKRKSIRLKREIVKKKSLLQTFVHNLELNEVNIFCFSFFDEIEDLPDLLEFGMAMEQSLCLLKTTKEIVIYDRYQTKSVTYLAPDFSTFMDVLVLLHDYDLSELKKEKFTVDLRQTFYDRICHLLKKMKYQYFYKKSLDVIG